MSASPQVFEMIGIPPRSDYDLALLAEKGISTDSLASLRERGLTFSEISDLIISPRTLKHRKARKEPLSNEESDRLIRVARTLALAEEIFGAREKALKWLRMPDSRIENRAPLAMLATESGGRVVENMLWQIDEGVFA